MMGIYRAAACALVRMKVETMSRKISGEKRRSCDEGIGGVLSVPSGSSCIVNLCTSGLGRIVQYDQLLGRTRK